MPALNQKPSRVRATSCADAERGAVAASMSATTDVARSSARIVSLGFEETATLGDGPPERRKQAGAAAPRATPRSRPPLVLRKSSSLSPFPSPVQPTNARAARGSGGFDVGTGGHAAIALGVSQGEVAWPERQARVGGSAPHGDPRSAATDVPPAAAQQRPDCRPAVPRHRRCPRPSGPTPSGAGQRPAWWPLAAADWILPSPSASRPGGRLRPLPCRPAPAPPAG